MIRVRLRAAEFVIVIETDAELHPDLLDEVCARVKALFLEVQAGLPESGEGDDGGLVDK